MAAEAKLGLEWRKEYKRGGTAVGVARARDISNRVNLSKKTILRMHSYFSRHEVDKKGTGYKPGQKRLSERRKNSLGIVGRRTLVSPWAKSKSRKNKENKLKTMPIPNTDKRGREKKDFIDRCMADDTMVGEYDEGTNAERFVRCKLNTWKGKLSLPRKLL